MSRLNMKVQITLLKEAQSYFDNVQPVSRADIHTKQEDIVLTQEHIEAWLEVFYEDRIMMNTCNEAAVKR